jgi:type VI secretion system protein ImpM
MPTEPVTVVGYHGKVPSHGDFVSRGLPPTFMGPWDLWLQEAIHSSRQQLKGDWLDYYLTSPIYRFVLSPGICGDSTWMGIIMPSVDKVGRYYPMTICRMDKQSANPFTLLHSDTEWFDQIELLARSCLNDNFNLDGFYHAICQLSPQPLNQTGGNGDSQTAPNGCYFPRALRQPLSSTDEIPGILPAILDRLLKEHHFAYSVWYTQGSENVSPSLLTCIGFPPFDGIAALFDGNWQQWGWEGNQPSVRLCSQR